MNPAREQTLRTHLADLPSIPESGPGFERHSESIVSQAHHGRKVA